MYSKKEILNRSEYFVKGILNDYLSFNDKISLIDIKRIAEEFKIWILENSEDQKETIKKIKDLPSIDFALHKDIQDFIILKKGSITSALYDFLEDLEHVEDPAETKIKDDTIENENSQKVVEKTSEEIEKQKGIVSDKEEEDVNKEEISQDKKTEEQSISQPIKKNDKDKEEIIVDPLIQKVIEDNKIAETTINSKELSGEELNKEIAQMNQEIKGKNSFISEIKERIKDKNINKIAIGGTVVLLLGFGYMFSGQSNEVPEGETKETSVNVGETNEQLDSLLEEDLEDVKIADLNKEDIIACSIGGKEYTESIEEVYSILFNNYKKVLSLSKSTEAEEKKRVATLEKVNGVVVNVSAVNGIKVEMEETNVKEFIVVLNQIIKK